MNNELQNNLDFLIANLDNVSKNLKNKNSKKHCKSKKFIYLKKPQ